MSSPTDGRPSRPLRFVAPNVLLTQDLSQKGNGFYAQTTGIEVDFALLPLIVYAQQRQSYLLDPQPPNATRGYDLLMATATAFGDAAQVPSKLPDLSYLVAGDPDLAWTRIPAQFRAVGPTYDGSVKAIPLNFAPYLLYYHLGIFQRDNLTVPQTWEELADLAERYHGREGMFGACVMAIGCRAESLVLRSIFASYVQTGGLSHGVFWDPETLEPLVNTPAMEAALKVFRRLRLVGPTAPDAPLCVRYQFSRGQCLLAISDGAMFKASSIGKDNTTQMRGRMGLALVPGSTSVLDRSTRRMVTCTDKICPLAQGTSAQGISVNRPISLSSTILLVNGLSPFQYQFFAYQLASYLASPAVIGIHGLLREVNEFMPVRDEDLSLSNLHRWTEVGYDEGDVTRFLTTYRATTSSNNINPDMRVRLASNITEMLLRAAVLYNNVSLNASLPDVTAQMEAVLNGIVAAEGREAFAAQYRRSLNWVPAVSPSSVKVKAQRAPAKGKAKAWIIVGSICGAVLASTAAVAALIVRHRRRKCPHAQHAVVEAPGVGPQTTLCITDIQDSTTLWEDLSDVMNAALDEHHGVIRRLLLVHKGYECLTEGDSFIVAFSSSSNAVQFCLEAQQALLDASWPAQLLRHELSTGSNHCEHSTADVYVARQPNQYIVGSMQLAKGKKRIQQQQQLQQLSLQYSPHLHQQQHQQQQSQHVPWSIISNPVADITSCDGGEEHSTPATESQLFGDSMYTTNILVDTRQQQTTQPQPLTLEQASSFLDTSDGAPGGSRPDSATARVLSNVAAAGAADVSQRDPLGMRPIVSGLTHVQSFERLSATDAAAMGPTLGCADYAGGHAAAAASGQGVRSGGGGALRSVLGLSTGRSPGAVASTMGRLMRASSDVIDSPELTTVRESRTPEDALGLDLDVAPRGTSRAQRPTPEYASLAFSHLHTEARSLSVPVLQRPPGLVAMAAYAETQRGAREGALRNESLRPSYSGTRAAQPHRVPSRLSGARARSGVSKTISMSSLLEAVRGVGDDGRFRPEVPAGSSMGAKLVSVSGTGASLVPDVTVTSATTTTAAAYTCPATLEAVLRAQWRPVSLPASRPASEAASSLPSREWSAGPGAAAAAPPAAPATVPESGPISDGAGGSRDASFVVRSDARTLVFRGLRVRAGLSCGVVSELDIIRDARNGRVQYSGRCMRVAKLVADAAHGGMVLLADGARAALELDGEGAAALVKRCQPVVVWMGRHSLAHDLEDVQLFQVVSQGLLPRLALLQRPLRTLGMQRPLTGVMTAPLLYGAVARLTVPAAATLLAWNAAVAGEALDLVYGVLLEELRKLKSRPYVMEGALGLYGGGVAGLGGGGGAAVLGRQGSLGKPQACYSGSAQGGGSWVQQVQAGADPGSHTSPSQPSPVAKPPPGKAGKEAGAYRSAVPGVMTVAFDSADAAATWLLRALAVLPSLNWPAALLDHPLCEPLDLDLVAAVLVGQGQGQEQGAAAASPNSFTRRVPKRRDSLRSLFSGSSPRQPTRRPAALSAPRVQLPSIDASNRTSCSSLAEAPLSAVIRPPADDAESLHSQTVAGTPDEVSQAAARSVLRSQPDFVGLRAGGALVYGELGGQLPPVGSFSGQLVYKGRAWQALVKLAGKARVGQVHTNTETLKYLRPESAAMMTVVRSAQEPGRVGG